MTPLFHRGHYNVIAAQIKRELAKHDAPRIVATQRMYARNALLDLALAMAKRLQADNPEFDPLTWLDQCSPDPVEYPISELWSDYAGV